MGYDAGKWQWLTRPVAVGGGRGLAGCGIARVVVPAHVMAGVLGVLLLLPLIGCATPDAWDDGQPHRYRQDLVAAHPEWPSEILGAVAAGVICAGMTPDMVGAAWGRPTRLSSDGSGSHQRVTWHYEGRQHAAEMISSLAAGARPMATWKVWFANGWVVEWTN